MPCSNLAKNRVVEPHPRAITSPFLINFRALWAILFFWTMLFTLGLISKERQFSLCSDFTPPCVRIARPFCLGTPMPSALWREIGGICQPNRLQLHCHFAQYSQLVLLIWNSYILSSVASGVPLSICDRSIKLLKFYA